MESTTLNPQELKFKAALLQRGEDTVAVGLRDLKRYYTLLNHHLLELFMTAGEANLICEALKAYRFDDDPEQARTVWKQVDAAIQQNQLDQKWRVHRGNLIRKLQALQDLQVIALVDAVERYWAREQEYPHESLETRLLQVDLIKCCDFAL